jgi:orotate phosphoribosyltransferase
MDALAEGGSEERSARARLLEELREHALVIGEVTLTSGARAEYYVDAKRAILRPAGFAALGVLLAAQARACKAGAVGGVPVSAIPVACAALAAGFPEKAFIVRKERKPHGLQRWIEGPALAPGERCLIVEDVVTTGGSTIEAIERVRGEGLTIAAVVSVLDRLAGGERAIRAAIGDAPYTALSTIDDVYPERPDRDGTEPRGAEPGHAEAQADRSTSAPRSASPPPAVQSPKA